MALLIQFRCGKNIKAYVMCISGRCVDGELCRGKTSNNIIVMTYFGVNGPKGNIIHFA